MLLNGQGQVEAEAGALPDTNTRVSLLSALMGMFTAAQKAASLIDRNVTRLHLFTGEKTDAIFLPVGTVYGLFLVGSGLADHKNLPATMDKLAGAQVEILNALQKIGVVEVTSAPEPAAGIPAAEEPFTQPESLSSEFMDIFNQVGKKSGDANSFWDTAVEKGTTFAEPDKLTYDQAARLGLTPDAKDKKE